MIILLILAGLAVLSWSGHENLAGLGLVLLVVVIMVLGRVEEHGVQENEH